jgi:uncharacterized protein (DUF433 family)
MTMIATPLTEQIPIRRDEHGRLRVGNTRVLLDLVIYAYWRGDTPEGIVEQYPSLSLDDVYLALGYYLRHRADVDAYLREQKAEAERGERETPPELRPTLTREILLSRLRIGCPCDRHR